MRKASSCVTQDLNYDNTAVPGTVGSFKERTKKIEEIKLTNKQTSKQANTCSSTAVLEKKYVCMFVVFPVAFIWVTGRASS